MTSISDTAVSRQPKVTNRRRLAIGAEVTDEGGAHFRVWAPKCKTVELELGETPMTPLAVAGRLQPEPGGYFSGYFANARCGMVYRFRLPVGSFPDPASRFQPQGPHGPSQIVNPNEFPWTDRDWPGVPPNRRVIYEMHIGTFTELGTWAAAQAQLGELAQLGVTLLEIMPVADFPGRFGWGYDGVNLFSPTRLYGRPEELRAFVDQAHQLGIGVILDVVYNHFGPDGNYLRAFSDDYFSPRPRNEWGDALNFDGENSDAVREFFVENAGYWIQEFHLDGLRLDATQQIHDSSPEHILAVINRRVRAAANGRKTYLVAENEVQHAQLVRPPASGGYGLDALWNDDFHHCAIVACTGRREAYYSDYRGTPQELVAAAKYGFLYQGQRSAWQKNPRGTPAFGLKPVQFVNFLQNHDQVANSLHGLRLHQLAGPGRFRALTVLFLLLPSTPLLFQGQEFCSSSPFLYFADHHSELAAKVFRGRKEFLRQFPTIATQESQAGLDDPAAEQTFVRCRLNFAERQAHSAIYRFHHDLLKLRREDATFSQFHGQLEGAVLGPETCLFRFLHDQGDDRLIVTNLGPDLALEPAPEPLLAPPEGHVWEPIFSSESPVYGGGGTPPVLAEGRWFLLGQAALVLKATPLQGLKETLSWKS